MQRHSIFDFANDILLICNCIAVTSVRQSAGEPDIIWSPLPSVPGSLVTYTAASQDTAQSGCSYVWWFYCFVWPQSKVRMTHIQGKIDSFYLTAPVAGPVRFT